MVSMVIISIEGMSLDTYEKNPLVQNPELARCVTSLRDERLQDGLQRAHHCRH